MAVSNNLAVKHRPVGDRDARFEEAIFRVVESACVAMAVPPFESVKLPRGVIVSFVRADGSVLRTANIA
jgi:hypothetical protein